MQLQSISSHSQIPNHHRASLCSFYFLLCSWILNNSITHPLKNSPTQKLPLSIFKSAHFQIFKSSHTCHPEQSEGSLSHSKANAVVRRSQKHFVRRLIVCVMKSQIRRCQWQCVPKIKIRQRQWQTFQYCTNYDFGDFCVKKFKFSSVKKFPLFEWRRIYSAEEIIFNPPESRLRTR